MIETKSCKNLENLVNFNLYSISDLVIMEDKVYLFDTTLRDGQQTTGVNFSVSDKMNISQHLDDLGIDYIEGGWPGANPTDNDFFQEIQNFQKVN